MAIASELCQLLACPTTGESLASEEEALVSESGSYRYPLINGVPWLLPNPQNSLYDWGAKLQHFNRVLLEETHGLERQLKHAEGATADRLQRLLEGKQEFIRRVSELLVPIIKTQPAPKNIYDALRDRAPSTQNLLSYEANLYRDWVWGDEENQLTANLVLAQLKKREPKKMLILGAGAGRLALDLHRACEPDITVATDINPLLVLAAQAIFTGQTLPIYEFPLQPIKSEYVALEHNIVPVTKPKNFHMLFADATKPAFKKHAFDAVVTPWFIDIQPLEFGRFLRQLNQYLPVGAHWINFGSLVFNQNRDALCYAIDEVNAIAGEQGFEIKAVGEHDIPYLKSPYNAGHRMEHVWVWTAEKTRDVKPLQNPQVLPPWILDDKQAIPKNPYFEQFSKIHRVYAQLTAEVDGKTSLNKIAKKLARQNKMDEGEALHLVREFFADLHRQNG